jgi:hypothetical protein
MGKILGSACLILLLAVTAWAAPTVTTLTPGAVYEGKITVATIEGTGFVAGATVTFEAGGILELRSAEVKSATKLELYIDIQPGILIGVARDLFVTNPDGTTARLAGALTVNTNPGTVRIGAVKFSTPTGFVDYTSGLRIDPGTLYLSALITADAGISIANGNAKLLLDHGIWADNLSSQLSPEAGGLLAYFYHHGTITTTGDIVLTLYAEDDAGVPGRTDCQVTVAAPQPPDKPTAGTVIPSPNKNPTAANPMTLQFKIDSPITRQLKVRLFGVSPSPVKTLVVTPTQPGYVEVSFDGSDDAGGMARSGVYMVTVDDGSTILAKGKVVIFR